MPSELSQIILAKDVFLSSRSWEDVNAVLSVFNLAFGAFSCQKRSPILRRRNCEAKMNWNVGPRIPPCGSLSSSNPEKREVNK